jgi:endonuclease G, mitochondrial
VHEPKPSHPKCPHEPPRLFPIPPRDIEEAFVPPTADELQRRCGFDSDFISPTSRVPLPAFEATIEPDAFVFAGSPVLRYEHFSLAMSVSRRMTRWVAWNIDGGALLDPKGLGREGLPFRADPRVPPERQILDDQYKGKDNPLDRGHISRRADLLWGTFDEGVRANADSFYFPNITPQMDDFNRSSLGGLWGCLENEVLHQVGVRHARVSLLGGPVLKDDDPAHGTIQVPEAFWKIFLYRIDDEPRAKAFLLTQDLSGAGGGPREWATFERTVADIARRTSLRFDTITEWDRLDVRDEAALGPVRDLGDIRW